MAAELVAAVAEFLETDVRKATDGRVNFHARVAANVLRAVERELLDDAIGELTEATAELRELARGIHPAVLTDRGLDAAVNALAGRATVGLAASTAFGSVPLLVVATLDAGILLSHNAGDTWATGHGGLADLAAQTVEALDHQHIETAREGVRKQRLAAAAQRDRRGPADSLVGMHSHDDPALLLGALARRAELIIDRRLALLVGAVAGVENGSHVLASGWANGPDRK